jgi:hypothetical protein
MMIPTATGSIYQQPPYGAKLVPFGNKWNNAAKTLEPAATKIRNIRWAELLYNNPVSQYLKHNDLRVQNMSLEDLASRSSMLFAVYIPQGYQAYKKRKHFYETMGRNALAWTIGLAITMFAKGDDFIVNRIFSMIMDKKKTPEELAKHPSLGEYMKKYLDDIQKKFEESFTKLGKQPPRFSLSQTLQRPYQALEGAILWALEKPLNPLRLDMDYHKLLKKAGVTEKTSWTKMDKNHMDKLVHYIQGLQEKAAKGGLNAEEKLLLEVGKKFRGQQQVFKMAAFGIITALNVYVIGGLVAKLTFKLFAPFDADFTGAGKLDAQKSLLNKAIPTEKIQVQPKPLGQHQKAFNTPLGEMHQRSRLFNTFDVAGNHQQW